MFSIILKINLKREEIAVFLQELKDILNSESFNINTDFFLNQKNKPDDMEHSTTYTLLDLEYNAEDVIETLKDLTVSDFSEARIDKDDLNPPVLYVFGKFINKKTVYIKLKIRKTNRKCIICVSFHYAKEKMLFPYA